jgi:hypothetical protein
MANFSKEVPETLCVLFISFTLKVEYLELDPSRPSELGTLLRR